MGPQVKVQCGCQTVKIQSCQLSIFSGVQDDLNVEGISKPFQNEKGGEGQYYI